jgi:hypothetical protein
MVSQGGSMNAMRNVCVAAVLILSGCGDPITKLINDKFPPINVDQQRQAAVDTTAQALSKLPTPNIAFALNLLDAEKALYTESLRKEGISDLRIRGADQLIHVHAKFSRKFSEADAGDNQDARNVLAMLRPEITGTIDAYTGVSGAVVSDVAPMPELQLRLLPGLSRVEVENIKLAEKADVTKVGELLAALLNKYRDNITGELTRAPFSRLSVPAVAEKPFDLTQSFKVDSPGTSFKVTVQANPIIVPVKLAGVAWLVADDQLTALIQLSPLAGTSPPSEVQVEKTFNAVAGQIEGLVKTAFGVKESANSTWVAVRKDLIATTMNSAVRQAGACVTAVGNSHQKTESKVPMPSGDGIDCSSDRNCESQRTCTFSASKDERNCSTCLLHTRICAPKLCGFGGCIGGGCTDGHCVQEGNNPLCELAKAGQNQIYLADANLRKADCDRLRAMETAGCQAEELGKKTLCETGKAALNALRKTGNFANVDVETELKSDNLNVCLRDFRMAPGLDRVAFTLDVTGQAAADVDVKFVPLDIVGHLTCQFPWREKQRFSAELRDSKIGINSAMKVVTTQEKAHLNFAIDETIVKAKLTPGPTEFLLKSPNMTISCAGLNFIKPLVVTLTPFIPALRGDIDHKVDKQNAMIDIPLPAPQVGDLAVRVVASETPEALLLNGTLKNNSRVASAK